MKSKQAFLSLSLLLVGAGQLSAMESQVANPYLDIRGRKHQYPFFELNSDELYSSYWH